MGRRTSGGAGSKRDLLALWMGDDAAPLPTGRHQVRWAVLVGASALGAIMLTGYSRTVLPYVSITLGLLAAGLTLRILGRRVVQSRSLSAAWLVIIVLAAALAAYFFLAPDIDSYTLSRYLPRAVVDFFR
jgi:hypothetical protein